MSLQHDVKRYDMDRLLNAAWVSGAQAGANFVEAGNRKGLDEAIRAHDEGAGTKDYVLFTDYEAVRGEVERLTAEKSDLEFENLRLRENWRIKAQQALDDIKIVSDQRFAERQRAETAESQVEFLERELNNFRRNAAHRAEQLAKEKVETAEASLRSLRDATLEEALVIVNQYKRECNDEESGRHAKAALGFVAMRLQFARTNLTPAAPDSTKSTESTAARKDKM